MPDLRNAVITGGAGFIGSHLADTMLHRGFRVCVVDNLRTGLGEQVPAGARFIEGDVCDPDVLERAFEPVPDVVLHLAGQASIRLAWANPAADLNVNVGGTLNVLRACRTHKVGRLLYASSMMVYGNPDIVPTPETAPPAPVAHYGVTKYAAERYVQLAADDPDHAVNVTSLRMFNVYGPRQRLDNPYQGVLAIFLGQGLRGEPITIHSDGEQSRDFVFIDDVCRAWADAIDCEAAYGRVLNVGSGTPTSVNTLCDTVLAALGHSRTDHEVGYAPAQPGDVRVSAADVAQIHEVLGWKPATSLEDGMLPTVEWARGELLSP